MPEPNETAAASSKWREKFKDLLEQSLVWFALGMLVAGGIGAIGFLKFVESRVRTEIQSPEIKDLLAKQFPSDATSFPKGSIILFGAPCPVGWEDLTTTMNGRYLYVDQSAVSPVLYEDDGGHEHGGGNHPHQVTGQTAALGGGERSGDKEQRHSAHMNNVVSVTGTAHPENSNHTHVGGAHQHKRVGLRLCKR